MTHARCIQRRIYCTSVACGDFTQRQLDDIHSPLPNIRNVLCWTLHLSSLLPGRKFVNYSYFYVYQLNISY